MSNNKPTIICVTGLDGSGKSTLINHLIPEVSNAIEVSIWDALNTGKLALFSSKKEVDDYLCMLSPNARLLFLAHALQYAIDTALISSADTIFINAYYYKYFSSEKALGADQKLIDSLIESLPKPDITIYLSISSEISAGRKKHRSQYECGCKEATVANFIIFQKKTDRVFKTYIQPEWFELDAENSSEILKQQTLKIITQ
jgi:thymidylate kinase